jgi:hypothetical protein
MTQVNSAASLSRRFKSLNGTRRSIETLCRQGRLSRRACEQMYEALFLSAFTAFESFLEELFVALLVHGQGTGSPRPKVQLRSAATARSLLAGPGKKYADWLPLDNTHKRALVYFERGRPFSKLQDKKFEPMCGVLERGHVIRNAIAHKSRHSLRKFETSVLRGVSVGTRERTPAGYLRGLMTITPLQTRMEVYLSNMLYLARTLDP